MKDKLMKKLLSIILCGISINAFANSSMYISKVYINKMDYAQREIPKVKITQYKNDELFKVTTLKGNGSDRVLLDLSESTTSIVINPIHDDFMYINNPTLNATLQSVNTYIRKTDGHRFNTYIIRISQTPGYHSYNACIYMTENAKPQEMWLFYYIDVVNRTYKFDSRFNSSDEVVYIDEMQPSPEIYKEFQRDCYRLQSQ